MTPPTILVIDDDPYIRELFQVILEDYGYRVVEAADGREGYETALRERPRLVLLDLMLPVWSGLAVLDRLKSRADWVAPVLMMTAQANEPQQDYAYFLGADDFLDKPIDRHELLATLNRYCPILSRPAVAIPA